MMALLRSFRIYRILNYKYNVPYGAKMVADILDGQGIIWITMDHSIPQPIIHYGKSRL
jgi:hypothetical protein